MQKITKQNNYKLFQNIKILLEKARGVVVQTVNTTMVLTYFEIGRLIVEDEQVGKTRAKYGAETLQSLSQQLTKDFGKGFSVQNLERMRMFYLKYSKSSTLSRESKKSEILSSRFNLSWSHYVFLIKLDDAERNFYETESIKNNWSLRELKRQFDSSLFERLMLSKDKKGVLKDNLKKYHEPQKPQDIIKDPYVLEFLGIEESEKYSESELEQSIIDKIENFLLELGKGFAFIGRQQRFSFDEEHFFVDLVFYNRLLKCFVLIDLKIGKLKHQDLGQMQMYVNYYNRFVKTKEESQTIGIILCKDKNETLVEITLPEKSNIFAGKYQLYLPSKEELRKQIEGL